MQTPGNETYESSSSFAESFIASNELVRTIHERDNQILKLVRLFADQTNRIELGLSDSPVVLFSQDRDLRYDWMLNPRHGYSLDEVIGKTDFDLLPRESAERLTRVKQSVLETGRAAREEVRYHVRSGEEVVYDITVRPIFDSDGRVVGIVSTSVDVTLWRLAEERLDDLLRRENQARVRIEALQAVTDALSNVTSPNEVVAVISKLGMSAIGASHALFAEFDHEKHVLEIVGAIGYDNTAVESWRHIALDDDVPLAQAARERGPVWVLSKSELLERYPALADHQDTNTVSVAAIPLTSDDRFLGVLGLSFQCSAMTSAEDQNFVITLAQQCAQAMERIRLFETEQRARHDAERLAEAREEFLSTASHQLKTPLTSLNGNAQLLLRHLRRSDPVDQRALSLAENILRDTNRFDELIYHLLDVSRIQNGRFEIRPEPVELDVLLGHVVEKLRDGVTHHGERVIRLYTPEKIRGAWDPAQLEQVFSNLISNALKYSPTESEVRVVARTVGHHAEVSVHDDGIGIDNEEMLTLFEPFARGPRAADWASGHGLGLFISKQIVDRHHGTIDVESQRGIGTTFTVRLPLESGDDAKTGVMHPGGG